MSGANSSRNFALMKYDPNWSGSEVISTHKTYAAANREFFALGNVRGYYVARRKADGEFESPLESTDRCDGGAA